MAEDQGQESGQGVLGRLLKARDQSRLGQGGAAALPRPQPVTALRAATTAVARAVEGLYGLPVAPLEVTPAAITLAEMAELLPRPALLSVVEGAGEAIGVVALCPTLMTALIEVQTLGRVTSRLVEARRITRSDAMICSDFVNALLARLGDEMTRIDGFEGFGSFRYASFLDDPRPLLLMLEDSPYRSLHYRLRLGQPPGREGEIFVALPQRMSASSQAAAKETQTGIGRGRGEAAAIPPAEPGPLEPDLALRMRDAPIDVVGVLCRRRLRLGVLRQLRPGQILSLPRVDLAETRLETRLGKVLATGKLGEAGGYHAVRLSGAGEALSAPASLSARASNGQDGAWSGRDGGAGVSSVAGLPVEPPIADLDRPDSFRAPLRDAVPSEDFADAPRKSALSG
ncbi:FliM/FliN family flagellar motor switch protein [uncultured Paracoccus sp.]|uniref:FliM/FliN family flagellar motor switch protein n=1 Tax=uncultured Paracoccus sp. TaxID=189685 RepID=UPI002607B2FD|nr:FliM/FliN family flagellar motor switch protein [uncultured Paracoccus sp.]